jgi:uncharacterized protein (DUF433 family)
MNPELLKKLQEVVWVDPDRLSGAPCFKGTRIPVQMLGSHWMNFLELFRLSIEFSLSAF